MKFIGGALTPPILSRRTEQLLRRLRKSPTAHAVIFRGAPHFSGASAILYTNTRCGAAMRKESALPFLTAPALFLILCLLAIFA